MEEFYLEEKRNTFQKKKIENKITEFSLKIWEDFVIAKFKKKLSNQFKANILSTRKN